MGDSDARHLLSPVGARWGASQYKHWLRRVSGEVYADLPARSIVLCLEGRSSASAECRRGSSTWSRARLVARAEAMARVAEEARGCPERFPKTGMPLRNCNKRR